MSATLRELRRGSTGEPVRELQAATNRRLRAAGLGALVVAEDGQLGDRSLTAIRKAAWRLGAQKDTYDAVTQDGRVSIGVQRMIRNPGRRSERQMTLGRRRLAAMHKQRKAREQMSSKVSPQRQAVVSRAKQAAVNYRRQPGAYHYLAGGKANLVYLRPTPRAWRSDCSQFVSSVYKDAGMPSPGDVAYQWVNTWAIDREGRVTNRPQPGDLGLYGPKGNPHHVELYVGEPGCMFIGHGSPPIDSLTPGLPSYYVTYDFLD